MVQETFGTVDSFEPGRRDPILDRIGAERVGVIRSASPLKWLPVGLDIALMEAWFAEDGEAEVRSTLRSDFVRTLDQPILRPIITGARAVFGGSTERIVSWMPHAWSVIYRNAGTPEVVEVEKGCVELRIRNLPAAIIESPRYLDTISAVMAGFLDHAKEEDGRVSLDFHDDGSARLLVEWTL